MIDYCWRRTTQPTKPGNHLQNPMNFRTQNRVAGVAVDSNSSGSRADLFAAVVAAMRSHTSADCNKA